jgi:small multidrug resistance pump
MVSIFEWFNMNAIFIAYGLLALAIISEVTGSIFLVKSEGFTRLGPSLLVVIFYIISFYLLSQVIKTIPLGIAYAIWGGVGIVLTAFIGFLIFRQNLDIPAVIGIIMIVGGVIVMNVFSKSVGH